jgi:phospholipase C
MIFVSAYTSKGLVNNDVMDFGAIANFIEGNFGIPEGALGFDDECALPHDLSDFYNLNNAPRTFVQVPARHDAQWFIHDKTPPTPPDND